jgi:hypothetical protein
MVSAMREAQNGVSHPKRSIQKEYRIATCSAYNPKPG